MIDDIIEGAAKGIFRIIFEVLFRIVVEIILFYTSEILLFVVSLGHKKTRVGLLHEKKTIKVRHIHRNKCMARFGILAFCCLVCK